MREATRGGCFNPRNQLRLCLDSPGAWYDPITHKRPFSPKNTPRFLSRFPATSGASCACGTTNLRQTCDSTLLCLPLGLSVEHRGSNLSPRFAVDCNFFLFHFPFRGVSRISSPAESFSFFFFLECGESFVEVSEVLEMLGSFSMVRKRWWDFMIRNWFSVIANVFQTRIVTDFWCTTLRNEWDCF